VLAVGSVLLVGRARPALARQLVGGLCCLMATVGGYSGSPPVRGPRGTESRMQAEAERRLDLVQQLDGLRQFELHRKRICADLLAERIDVPTAVREMSDCLDTFESRLARYTRRNMPETNRPDHLAAFLYFGATQQGPDDQALARLGKRIGRLYPKAPLVDQRHHQQTTPYPWSRNDDGREVVLTASSSQRNG